MREIIFHVDVGKEEGWGHLQETINIINRIKLETKNYSFLIKQNKSIKKILNNSGHKVNYISNLEDDIENKIVVSNLIKIDKKYKKLVKKKSYFWIVITENKKDELADLNFNISLEPKYFPLNDIFSKAKKIHYKKDINKIFISFGGSDPKNITLLVLEFIRQGVEREEIDKNIKLEVIVGSLFQYDKAIKSVIKNFPLKCEFHKSLSQNKFRDLAQSCDIAITTGGGTMYEFCSLGMPVIIIPILNKMRRNALFYKRKNAIILLGRADRICAQNLISAINKLKQCRHRRRIGINAKSVIDGKGANRISSKIIKLCKKSE